VARITFQKRQKEMKRKEKRQMKAEKRAQRKIAKNAEPEAEVEISSPHIDPSEQSSAPLQEYDEANSVEK
jgi:hypothetical protein